MNEIEDIKNLLSVIIMILLLGTIIISSLLMCVIAGLSQIITELRRKPDFRWYDMIEKESEAHEEFPS